MPHAKSYLSQYRWLASKTSSTTSSQSWPWYKRKPRKFSFQLLSLQAQSIPRKTSSSCFVAKNLCVAFHLPAGTQIISLNSPRNSPFRPWRLLAKRRMLWRSNWINICRRYTQRKIWTLLAGLWTLLTNKRPWTCSSTRLILSRTKLHKSPLTSLSNHTSLRKGQR